MITNPNGKVPIVFLLICLLLLTSCAANYKAIRPEPEAMRHELNTGDTVRILTKGGKILTFEVVEITEDAIKGASQEILLSDVEEIKKLGTGTEEKASRKAAFNKYVPHFLVFGAVAIVAIVAVVAFIKSGETF